jgi:leucyl-tRNA synthetase
VRAEFLTDDTLEIVVQVGGKLRGKVAVPKDAAPAAVEQAAKPAVAAWLEGKSVAKVVHVPGRLVNFIVK